MDLQNFITERHIIGNRKNAANREEVHIAFGIDRNFTLGMGVLMTSILIHNKKQFIIFHVFTDGLTSDDIARLTQLTSEYDNCSVHTYYIDNTKLKSLPAWYIWTVAIWYRFLIAVELYQKVKYVWYLDSDELCLNEIKPLQFTDDSVFLALKINASDDEKKRIAKYIKSGEIVHFSSSNLYINVDAWMLNDITGRAFHAADSKPDFYKYPDGDVLLEVVQHKWQSFGEKYNYIYNLINNHEDVPKDTVFMHFAGTCKPWQAWGQDNKICVLWRKYQIKSPWHDIPLQYPKTYKQAKFMYKMMKRSHDVAGTIKWYMLYAAYKLKEKI